MFFEVWVECEKGFDVGVVDGCVSCSVQQANRRREVVDVSEWVSDVVFVCSGELFVGCFGCAFDACVECEDVGVRGGWMFAPHRPEDAFEFLCFGDQEGRRYRPLLGIWVGEEKVRRRGMWVVWRCP